MTRLERLQSRLDDYYHAEEAILSGAQAYSIGSRTMTRGSLREIRAAIATLENEIEAETARSSGKGKNKVVRVVPLG